MYLVLSKQQEDNSGINSIWTICIPHKSFSLDILTFAFSIDVVDEINGAPMYCRLAWGLSVSAKVSCLERLEYTICDIGCKIQLKIFNYLCLSSV